MFTGFEPFAGLARNPSFDVAVAASEMITGIPSSAKILPVTYEVGARFGASWLAKAPGRLLVSVGLGRGERRIRVERTAVSECGTTVDNDGVVKDRLEAGVSVRRHPEELNDLIEDLRGALPRFEVVLSDDAGHYVCNATFFHSLESARLHDGQAFFIHVPAMDPLVARRVGRAIGTVFDNRFVAQHAV